MAKQTAPSGYVIYEGPSMLTGVPIVCIATLHSVNRKTGDMLQTWVLLQDRDPIAGSRSGADRAICGDCPARGVDGKQRSCYVQIARAPLGVWNAWRRGRYPVLRGHAALAELGRGRKVRLGAYGDPAAIPRYANESLTSECAGHTAYSHQSDWAGKTGFDAARMMVSADSLAEAESAWAAGARTFRVVGAVDELVAGREILCPASEEAGKRTQCARCLLCGGASVQAKSIAIVVHGAGKKHHTAGRA